jgi:hypothetical protein
MLHVVNSQIRIMKRNIVIVLVIMSFSSCAPKEHLLCLSASFNEKARDEFFKNVDSYDMGRMTSTEKCIMQTTISRYLDSLNNWKLTIVDSFRVRTFDLMDVGTQFTFVANANDKFYFIFLPKLREYLVHDLMSDRIYNYDPTGEIILKDSVEFSVAKIDPIPLDLFVKENISGRRSYKAQFQQLDKLLLEFFPFLNEEILLPSFTTGLAAEPIINRRYIEGFFKPIFERTAVLSPGAFDYRIYELSPFGWIVIDYFVEDTASKSIGVDLFFVARKHSYPVHYETEWHKYKNCFTD